MADNYLQLAEEVLLTHGRPLTAQRILREAQRFGLMPTHLTGDTQQKTLQARISEDINKNKGESHFYRVGIGKYFLRDLASDPTLSARIKSEVAFSGRVESITKRRLLHTNRTDWGEVHEPKKIRATIEGIGTSNSFQYAKFPLTDQLLVGTFTVVFLRDSVLLHDLGKFSWFHGHQKGDGSSLGFRRYIDEYDDDIFSVMDLGIDFSSSREVLRNLALRESNRIFDDREIRKTLKIVDVRNDDEITSTFIIVAAFLDSSRNSEVIFRKRKSTRQLRWIERSQLPHERLDPFSLDILRSGVIDDLFSE